MASLNLTRSDVKVVKTETFNPDAMRALLYHEGLDTTVRMQLRKYYKRRRNGNQVDITYGFSAKVRGEGYGRIYAQGPSLQTFPRDVRAALAQDAYLDVDIVNCHPTLALALCRKNGWQCSAIAEYVDNREEVLASIMDEYGMTRADAKQTVLIIFYGGRSPTPLPGRTGDYLERMRVEVAALTANVCRESPKLLHLSQKKLAPVPEVGTKLRAISPEASVLAYTLQSIENSVLIAAMDGLEAAGVSADVLIYDGMLVRKPQDPAFDLNAVLNSVSVAVNSVLGYPVKFEVKPLTTSLVLPGYNDGPPSQAPTGMADLYTQCYPYAQVKEVFERTHFKVKEPVAFACITDEGEICYWSVKMLETFYKNLWCLEGGDMVRFVDKWVQDASMRTVKKIDFLPPPCNVPAGVYNTWQGFLIDRLAGDAAKGSVQPFLDHLAILTSHNELQTRYIEAFFAHMVQCPGEKPGVMLVFSGAEGSGKTLAFVLMEECLFGSDLVFSTVSPTEDLFGRFSVGRVRKVMVVINEANSKDSTANRDALWSAITDPVMRHEEKGVRPGSMRSCERYIMTSNQAAPCKADGRRPILMEVSAEKCGDTEYFKGFVAYMRNPDNGKAIMAHLRGIDLSQVNLQDRPMCELGRDVMASTADPETRFLDQLVKDFRASGDGNSSRVVRTSRELVRSAKDFYIIKLNFDKVPTDRAMEANLNAKLRQEHSTKAPGAFEKIMNYNGQDSMGPVRNVKAWAFNVPLLQAYMESRGFEYGYEGMEE